MDSSSEKFESQLDEMISSNLHLSEHLDEVKLAMRYNKSNMNDLLWDMSMFNNRIEIETAAARRTLVEQMDHRAASIKSFDTDNNEPEKYFEHENRFYEYNDGAKQRMMDHYEGIAEVEMKTKLLEDNRMFVLQKINAFYIEGLNSVEVDKQVLEFLALLALFKVPVMEFCGMESDFWGMEEPEVQAKGTFPWEHEYDYNSDCCQSGRM